MRKRLYIIIAVVVFILLGVFIYQQSKDTQSFDMLKADDLRVAYSPDLERVLENKIVLLTTLVQEPEIVQYILKVNSQYSEIEREKLFAIDKYWDLIEDSDPLLQLYETNKVAYRLKQLQSREPGFSEIFVTDQHGFNVAQTNKTSDIYQADEEWWQKAYDNGKGKSYAGLIEFDESSLTAGISVYLPVREPVTGKVIGIVKGVISIDDIKSKL